MFGAASCVLCVAMVAAAPRPVGAQSGSAAVSHSAFTTADVEFMQLMIGHHAQAIEVAGLAATGARRSDVHALADEIVESQQRELAEMQDWLVARGQWAPEQFAHHGEVTLTPGMLTREQVRQLESTRGAEFERRFLETLVAHHEGGLTMIADLAKLPSAGRDTELAAFLSRLAAEYRARLERIHALVRDLER